MKKILLSILSLILAVSLCLVAACAKDDPLELSHSSHTMLPGQVFYLTVVSEIGEEVPNYVSDNESVVTVKQTGEVEAVATGTANVNVTVAGKTATCKVTVGVESRVATLKLTNIDKQDGQYVLPLGINDEYPILTQIKFDGVKVDGEFEFHSSDTDVASVNANGVITTGTIAGETIISVNGSYNGRFEDVLIAEILVNVSDVEWSYSSDESKGLYPATEFKGNPINNNIEFDVGLKIGEKEVQLSQMDVTVGEGDYISIDGNVITAKKAGNTYFDLSYFDEATSKTYTRRQNVEVSRIVDNRLDEEPYTLTRLQNVSLSAFDEISADFVSGSQTDKATEKVIEITDGKNVQITALGGVYQNLTIGEKQVEIYNDSFVVKVNLHVIDYCVNDATEFKQVLYSISDEYVELGSDIFGVGTYKHPKSTLIFNGTIDGKGHVVDGITFSPAQGLFGLCSGTFKNIAIVNAELTALSAVLCNQSVGAGLKTDNVYIHVAKTNSIETEGAEVCCGGILLQVESGEPIIKNTIVEMYGINGKNAGALAGVWYNSTLDVQNSYFITDGNAYGEILGYVGDGGWSSIQGTLGIEANQNGIEYVFANGEEFNAERIKADSIINLNDFDSEIWDLNNNGTPRFKRDIREVDALLATATETTIKGANDEVLAMLATFSTVDYQVKLPEINEEITALYASGVAIYDFTFDTTTKILTFDYKDVSRFTTDNVQLVFATTSEKTYKTTFMLAPADSILRTAEDVTRVLSRDNGAHFVCYLLNDVDGAVVDNQAPYDDNWSDRTTIYGLGHKLTNLTVKGEGFLGALGSGLIKDLYIEITNFEPNYYDAKGRNTYSGALGGDLTNLVLENVYIKSHFETGMGKLALADTCLGGVTVKNSIFDMGRLNKIIGTEHYIHNAGDDLSTAIIINNDYTAEQFLAEYSDGLPESFENSYFEIRNGSLYYNNYKIYG
ncbi:MAG: Ig-like domain-containing protein [Clostridia bacterium]|nr:Ig-like domain-containing protein [Clostridia bacterium]